MATASTRTEAVLRPHGGPAGRRHRLLGRQAGLDSVRPITAIRFLFAGQEVLAWAGPGLGPRPIKGATGGRTCHPAVRRVPLGHSTFSAAAARCWHRFTGPTASGPRRPSRRAARWSSRGHLGRRRRAVLAHLLRRGRPGRPSRRYGGIHFKAGDLVGRVLGATVGARCWRAAAELLLGRPRRVSA